MWHVFSRPDENVVITVPVKDYITECQLGYGLKWLKNTADNILRKPLLQYIDEGASCLVSPFTSQVTSISDKTK